MLAFRITRPFQVLEAPMKMYADNCDKLIVYEHVDASRPHIHGLMVNPKISTDTMKNYVRKFLGKIDKTDWSFVTKDVNEKFIVYMSKGKLAPSFVKGFTEDQIEAYRNDWVSNPTQKKQIKLTYVVKETPVERNMRQKDMVEEIVRRLKDSNDWNATRDPECVIHLIYRVVGVENKNMLSRYKVRDYYDTVMSQLDNKTWMKQMVQLCAYNS